MDLSEYFLERLTEGEDPPLEWAYCGPVIRSFEREKKNLLVLVFMPLLITRECIYLVAASAAAILCRHWKPAGLQHSRKPHAFSTSLVLTWTVTRVFSLSGVQKAIVGLPDMCCVCWSNKPSGCPRTDLWKMSIQSEIKFTLHSRWELRSREVTGLSVFIQMLSSAVGMLPFVLNSNSVLSFIAFFNVGLILRGV